MGKQYFEEARQSGTSSFQVGSLEGVLGGTRGMWRAPVASPEVIWDSSAVGVANGLKRFNIEPAILVADPAVKVNLNSLVGGSCPCTEC